MTMENKRGIDISSHNGDVDLKAVKKAGYEFVMIRCGYGSDIKEQDDIMFHTNVKKCEQLGIPWGAYLYSYAANIDEAKSEVEHIHRLLKNYKPKMPIAIDIEDSQYYIKHGCYNKESITSIVRTIINGLRAKLYYPMLYTGLYWLDELIDKSVYQNVDMWIAQWNVTCQYKYDNLGMWQYGGETNYIETPYIDGVNGKVDKDKCYCDYPTIIQSGGYNGYITKPVLDTKGYKRGDKTIGVLALKELMLIANYKAILPIKVNEDNVFGDGTEKNVNYLLAKYGYQPNSIAGNGFIKLITKYIKENIKEVTKSNGNS